MNEQNACILIDNYFLYLFSLLKKIDFIIKCDSIAQPILFVRFGASEFQKLLERSLEFIKSHRFSYKCYILH